MKKNLAIILTLALSLTLSEATGVSAKRNNKHITPYGDFCTRASHYGMHKHMLNDKEVRQALEYYFSEKGLDFEVVNSRGRFVKAVIRYKGNIVDTIIFDRHTGRIRSVH